MDTQVIKEVEGVTPEPQAAQAIPTIEELQKKLADAEHLAENKTQEAARHYKKIEAFEKAEKLRAEAALSKEQLQEKRTKEAEATVAKVRQEAEANLAKITADAETRLLKAAFLLKAKDMGFDNPDDAYALANKSVIRKEDGDYDVASIEEALKPLIGRLPVKAQGDGKGTPKLPPAPQKQNQQQKGRAFQRTF